MGIHFNPKFTVISASISSTVSAVAAGASSMIGRNWLSVGVCGGFGFGLVQGTVSKVASHNMPKICPRSIKPVVSEFVGGAAACGLSYAAASIGFIAAPVSIPTAAALTAAVVAFKYFFGNKITACVDAGIEKLNLLHLLFTVWQEARAKARNEAAQGKTVAAAN